MQIKTPLEQRLYNALHKIAKQYMTPAQIRRDDIGLDYEEYLEMSYENIQMEARNAIHGVRKMKPPPQTTED